MLCDRKVFAVLMKTDWDAPEVRDANIYPPQGLKQALYFHADDFLVVTFQNCD